METLLTVKDVAARLAIGRTVVYELIARGDLKTIKIGRARRIPESALQERISLQLRAQGDEKWETEAMAKDQFTRQRKARGEAVSVSADESESTSPARRARK